MHDKYKYLTIFSQRKQQGLFVLRDTKSYLKGLQTMLENLLPLMYLSFVWFVWVRQR